ncbi:MAG: extracellular solute-binding protein [Candidatus Lokiarchaeota archaeon]|nr:extracellular solute-binding protein [Candidatus Lokiarchaeota archaeon]
MTKYNKKALFVLTSLVLLITPTFFSFPIKLHSKPVSSQAISLTIYVTDQQMPGVVNVTDDFLASPLGSGVTSVTVVSTGISSNERLAFLQTLMTGGTATSAVIGLDVVWTAIFADNGWIINLDPYLDPNEMDDYVAGLVDAGIWNGHLYAYPYFNSLGALFYRTDLLDLHMSGWTEADFDTWEELNATANYILNNESGLLTTADADLVGYVGQFDAYEGGVINFFEWVGSNGVLDAITSTGEVNVNTQDVNDALTFVKALIAPQYTGVQGNDYIIPRYGLVHDEGSSVSKWLNNESIFMRQWPFAYGLSEDNNMDFGLSPLPHFANATSYRTSVVGGALLAIPTTTTGTAREAAVNLTKFLGDSVAQEAELTEVSNFPALSSVYASPPSGFEWIQNWTDQLPLTLSRPVHQDYPLISDVIADYFNDLLSCQKSVDEALFDMERDIKAIINVPPGSFELSTNAGTPDDDGIFNLMWTNADGALNYSVYDYLNYITEINGSLTLLMEETTDLSLPLSGYTDGTYYFIVVAYNDYGNILSNCIEVIVQLPSEPQEPVISGYDTFLLIVVIGTVLIIIVKKRRKTN